MKLVGKRARWIIRLEPYNFSIIHKAGRKYNNADSLSRMYEKDKLLEEVNFFDLPTEQEAFEAALKGNPITIPEDNVVEIFYLENDDNNLNLWSDTVSLLKETSTENNKTKLQKGIQTLEDLAKVEKTLQDNFSPNFLDEI